MISFIKQAVTIFGLYCVAILGAWLAGAEVTWWAFALGGFFALGVPTLARLLEKHV